MSDGSWGGLGTHPAIQGLGKTPPNQPADLDEGNPFNDTPQHRDASRAHSPDPFEI